MLHSPGVASSSVCVLGGVQPCVGVLCGDSPHKVEEREGERRTLEEREGERRTWKRIKNVLCETVMCCELE